MCVAVGSSHTQIGTICNVLEICTTVKALKQTVNLASVKVFCTCECVRMHTPKRITTYAILVPID